MFQHVTDFIENRLDSALQNTGWLNISKINYVGNLATNFAVYKRVRPLVSVINLTTNEFSKYSSLKDILGFDSTLLVACDSEWVSLENNDGSHQRYVLSWQFAFISQDMLVEVIYLAKQFSDTNPLSGRLNLLDAISVAFCLHDKLPRALSFDIRKYRRYVAITKDQNGKKVEKTFSSKKEALAVSSDVKTKFAFPKDFYYYNICMLFHTGLVDLTAFDASARDMVLDKNLLDLVFKRLTQIHHGLVSMKKIKIYPKFHAVGNGHFRLFPMNLSIRDTLTHTPPKQGSLAQLGTAIGIPKVDIPASTKEHMDAFLLNDPVGYFEYASTDSVITLLYASSLYGVNVLPKVTITSAAASVMRNVIADYLGIERDDREEFDKIYRGLRKVTKGTVATGNVQVPYIQAMDVEPINLETQAAQYMASFAYHGGYNGCSEVGYFTNHTNDFDLKNAYPTAMVLVPDINWEKPIKREFNNISLPAAAEDLFGTSGSLPLVYAHVQAFKFPADTAFPCIPVVVEGIPVYPLEYDEKAEYCKHVPGVYVTGPELLLAYKLGATVTIDKAYELATLSCTEDNTIYISYSLAEGVKSLIEDRAQAKAYAKTMNLKNYLPDTILKIMVNSCYGKVAQNVIEKRTWDAYSEEMTTIGASFITNPVSASMITAIIRCVLIAAQNQCVAKGYHVYSVTTDGFISDVSEEVLAGLDLYGFTQWLYEARMFLTNNQSGAIWEVKHQQDDLLNFTTRGNVSLDVNGVLARNNVVTNVKPSDIGSYAERLWLMDQVLSRTGKIEFESGDWTKFKSIVLKKADDFDIVTSKKHISMDYDMKRKPVYESFKTVKPIIAGKEYQIACFTTVPYTDIGEYKRYKTRKDTIITERKDSPSKALRTLYDWENRFFAKLDKNSTLPEKSKGSRGNRTGTSQRKSKAKNSASDIDQINEKKIRNCLYAHRAGVISIPLLKEDINEFFYALNCSTLCKHRFSKDNYKNYLKRERWSLAIQKAVNQIEYDSLAQFLEEQEPIYSYLLNLKAVSHE